MSVECSIDTNLFLYRNENIEKRKSSIAGQIIGKGIRTKNAGSRFQDIQECLNVLPRKALVPLNPPEADRHFDSVRDPLWPVKPNPDLYDQGIGIRPQYRSRCHDSLMFAASLSAVCRILCAEDLYQGQKKNWMSTAHTLLPKRMLCRNTVPKDGQTGHGLKLSGPRACSLRPSFQPFFSFAGETTFEEQKTTGINTSPG